MTTRLYTWSHSCCVFRARPEKTCDEKSSVTRFIFYARIWETSKLSPRCHINRQYSRRSFPQELFYETKRMWMFHSQVLREVQWSMRGNGLLSQSPNRHFSNRFLLNLPPKLFKFHNFSGRLTVSFQGVFSLHPSKLVLHSILFSDPWLIENKKFNPRTVTFFFNYSDNTRSWKTAILKNLYLW